MGKTTTRDKAEARRTLITEAALTVIIRDGMGGLSSRAVAREAGINSAMVHYAFDNMQALVRALMTRVVEGAAAVLDEVSVEGQSLSEAIETLAHAFWQHVVDEPELARAQYELTLHALSSGLPELAQAQYEGYLQIAADKFGQTCDLSEDSLQTLAGACVGMVDGITLQFLTTQDVAGCERRIQMGVRFMQTLLRKENLNDNDIAGWSSLAGWRH